MVEEMAQEEKKSSGCGLMVLYNGVFRRRSSSTPRRSSSAGSIPPCGPAEAAGDAKSANSKRRRGASDEAALIGPAALAAEPRAPIAESRAQMPSNPQKGGVRRPPEPQVRALPGPPGLSGDLDSVIYDHQRAKESSTLVRASSSNVMLFGNLGNLRTGNPSSPPARNVLDYLPKTAKEMNAHAKPGNAHGGTNGVAGNLMNGDSRAIELAPAPVMCRALSRRLDPDELKDMGNEEYKKGRFAEALALYDRAILMNPEAASYWSNKAAALTGLGRLLEAVSMCREAVRIEPGYCRAHHRLGKLYFRLGEAEKALHHYRAAGSETSSVDSAKARTLQGHLTKRIEARKLRDWQTVLKEAQSAISAGADSAPQVFASQAEALLKLQRHQEADTVFIDAPTFDVDASTRFFGPAANAYFLSVRAQVNMAAGRFDDAVSQAQRAVMIDTSNKDVAAVSRRTRAVASSRFRGNELFKASKFAEACTAYGEGIDHDPQNSVLLCNRAACLSKVGKWEKAIEDCNMALKVRPAYHKARLRRADCYAKLEWWEASLQDYEALAQEMPGDEEVGKMRLHIQNQLKDREQKEGVKLGGNLITIKTNDQFNRIIISPGTCVVFFCNKADDSKMWLSMEQLCRQYPLVNFLKVDMEDNPSLVKSEEGTSVPSFKIYKNGSKVKDLAGSDHDLLESSLRVFSI
uniref:Inactive TPR repeat-containing thioredoxin TTL3 n=1 Tax=Anthurium amnicola TaxID=1678845 RepID=A0A1D1XG15_9ARAE